MILTASDCSSTFHAQYPWIIFIDFFYNVNCNLVFSCNHDFPSAFNFEDEVDCLTQVIRMGTDSNGSEILRIEDLDSNSMNHH